MLLELKRIRNDWGPLTLFVNGEMVPNIKTTVLRSDAEEIPVLTVEFYCSADPEAGVIVREGVVEEPPYAGRKCPDCGSPLGHLLSCPQNKTEDGA